MSLKFNLTMKNIMTSLMQQMVVIICGFIVPRLIIENFGSNVNGLIVSITQFLGYITLLDSGFGPIVKSILYKPIAQKNVEEIKHILKASESFFRRIALIFVFYVLVLIILYPTFVSGEFDSLFTISLIVIISISIFIEYFFGMTYKLYLQAEQKAYITNYIQIIMTILNTFVILILIYFDLNVQLVKLSSSFIFLLRPLLLSWYVKRKYSICFNKTENNYIIKQKWDALVQHIAFIIHTNTDVVIITIFLNIKEVSVYSVYMLVINGIRNLSRSFLNGVDALWGNLIATDDMDGLRKNFDFYEFAYNFIISVLFICTLILVVPFVRVYTSNFSDVNYIRPVFAILITLSEFICAIRQPYNDLIKAAGHFKQTRNGALLETIINLIVSVCLIFWLGITGVAIGTLIAMIVRALELIWYSSKRILKRNNIVAYIKIGILIIETTSIFFICKLLPLDYIFTYSAWFKYALVVFILTVIFVILINSIFNFNYMKQLMHIVKSKLVKDKN